MLRKRKKFSELIILEELRNSLWWLPHWNLNIELIKKRKRTTYLLVLSIIWLGMDPCFLVVTIAYLRILSPLTPLVRRSVRSVRLIVTLVIAGRTITLLRSPHIAASISVRSTFICSIAPGFTSRLVTVVSVTAIPLSFAISIPLGGRWAVLTVRVVSVAVMIALTISILHVKIKLYFNSPKN